MERKSSHLCSVSKFEVESNRLFQRFKMPVPRSGESKEPRYCDIVDEGSLAQWVRGHGHVAKAPWFVNVFSVSFPFAVHFDDLQVNKEGVSDISSLSVLIKKINTKPRLQERESLTPL